MLFSIPDDISYHACGFVCFHSMLVKNLLISSWSLKLIGQPLLGGDGMALAQKAATYSISL